MLHQVNVGSRAVTPSKIVCVGRNYHGHIQELNNEVPDQMVLFTKPNSSISDQLFSGRNEPVHYEGELCFMVENGRFSGAGFGFDLTKRQLQTALKSKGLPWERAKAFDGSAVFSPFIDIALTPSDMTFELNKNETLVQAGDMALMIHQPDQILAEIQSFMSLEDGDIIMTGTPEGVGAINPGDVFSATVKQGRQTIIQKTWAAI